MTSPTNAAPSASATAETAAIDHDAGSAHEAAAPGGELPDAGEPDAAPPPPPVCPDPGMVRVGRTCVDRWEAHLVAPSEDGGFTPLPANERPPQDVDFAARTDPDVLPQAYVSRVEAARACKSAGKRLCSMTEWRRACQGPAGAHYPYGSRAKRGACNIGKPHLLAKRFGPDARLWKYDEHFNDPSLDLEEGFLARTGAYEGCESKAGTFDMSGNLHEWVSDVVDDAFVERMEKDNVDRKRQPWRTGDGVFVGGFFSTTDQHGPGCLFTTIAHEPAYHDYSIGFRCCAAANVPEEPPAKKRKPKPKPKQKAKPEP